MIQTNGPKKGKKKKKIIATSHRQLRALYLVHVPPSPLLATSLYETALPPTFSVKSFPTSLVSTPHKKQTTKTISSLKLCNGVWKCNSIFWGQDYFGHWCNWVSSKECIYTYPYHWFFYFSSFFPHFVSIDHLFLWDIDAWL